MPLLGNSGPGPPALQCSCSTCLEVPYHSVRCHFCQMCYFKVEEDLGKHNLIDTNGFDHYDFLPGNVVWLCPTCSCKSLAYMDNHQPEVDIVPKWFNNFVDKLKVDLENMDVKMNSNIDKLVADLSDVKQSVSNEMVALKDLLKSNAADYSANIHGVLPKSPIRKRKTPMESSCEQVVSATKDQALTNDSVYNAKITLNNGNSVQTVSALKQCCKFKSQSPLVVPDFKSQVSKKGDINLLFKSFKDALATKKLFDEKMENMNLEAPVRHNLRRIDLVGLPFAITKQEAIEALVRDNPNLGLTVCNDDGYSASVETNGNLFVSVLDIRKCYKSNVFRILLQVSNDFVTFLGNWRIKCMNIVLHKYIVPVSIQCFNCQRYGHFSGQCTHERVCGKCASTSHDTRNCDSSQLKCSNCVRNSSDDVAHAAFFHGCPLFNAIS